MTEQDSFQCSQTLMPTRLKRMLNPQSAVFIGGSALVPAIDYCRTNRFQGHIYVVNPFKAELAGIPCYASLADLPDVPDMAFIYWGAERGGGGDGAGIVGYGRGWGGV